MIKEHLYIDDRLVDMIPNTITRKLQINDFGELKNRQSSYSNTVKLPRTIKNIKIFDYLGVNGSNSRKPYEKLPCRYLVNGIPLIQFGYATIKATSENFEVVIYDGLIDLNERLKGKTLQDLDYSDLNHVINTSTFINSLTNTDGYIYALGDFVKPLGNDLQVDSQVPSLFVHTIFDKIITEAGISYLGDFFTENTDFLTEVITPQKGYELEDVDPTITPLGDVNTDTIDRFQISDSYFEFFDTHTISGNVQDFNISGSDLVSDTNGLFKFTINTSYFNDGGSVRLYTKVNNSSLGAIDLLEGGVSKQTILNLNLSAGDKVSFYVIGSPKEIGEDGRYRLNYETSSTVNVSSLEGGQLIDFKDFVGDLKQIDFIKDVMQRYGLIIKPMAEPQTYLFETFETILNDRANAEDWTHKIKTIDKTTYDSGYGQNNTATYDYPDEILSPFNDGNFILNNETLDGENSLFKSIYEMSVSDSTFKNQPLYKVPLFEEKDEDGLTIYEPKENPYKLFRLNYIDDSINVRYFDETNTTTFSGNVPFLGLNNISLQYYIGNFYDAFQALLENYKEIDSTVDVSNLDVYGLDFFKLKYLSQTGRYYYLNSLQHKAGEVSKATLIETSLSTLTNNPPSQIGIYSKAINYNSVSNITISNLTNDTVPPYFDPEFDEPLKVLVTGGFNSDVAILNGNNVINTQTEILVDDLDLKVKDNGNITTEHTANFTFKMADKGSGEYSDTVGSINITVNKYTNTPPVADAGDDIDYLIYPNDPDPNYFIFIDGSNSYDNTGDITSYDWSFVSKPANSGAVLQSSTSEQSILVIPNETNSQGVYTIKMTVTDEFGATNTDTVNVQVTADFHP